jgi:hypothetical protein
VETADATMGLDGDWHLYIGIWKVNDKWNQAPSHSRWTRTTRSPRPTPRPYSLPTGNQYVLRAHDPDRQRRRSGIAGVLPDLKDTEDLAKIKSHLLKSTSGDHPLVDPAAVPAVRHHRAGGSRHCRTRLRPG